jgi:oligosaccharyltransferase complex subunit alpha (ribophorin I)
LAQSSSNYSLKGHFSRLEHQKQSYARRGHSSAAHVFSGLSLSLPPRAFSPYFYDTVGNVSWSNFRPSHDAAGAAKGKKESLLELRPRYPLLGGWTYNFTIGYQAPLHHYLKKANGLYHLAVPFVTTLKSVPIDSAVVRILLPEGAQSVFFLAGRRS